MIGQYAFLTPSLSYDPTSVYLRLDASMCRPGSTGSQCSVGRAIETLGPGNTLYDAILWTDVANGNRTLDNLSGGIYDAAQTALIMNSVHLRDAINKRMLPSDGVSDGQAGWMTSWAIPDGLTVKAAQNRSATAAGVCWRVWTVLSTAA